MKTGKGLAAAIFAVIVALTVSACSANELNPDPAACQAALQAQYLQAAADHQPVGAEPSLCRKLPKAQVRQLEARVRAAQ